MISYKTLYSYIFSYMLLSMPVALVLHFQNLEISDIPILYAVFACFKLSLTLFLLRKAQFSLALATATLFFALSLRLLFSGPWMPFVLGVLLFISNKRKISSRVL